MSWLLVQFFQFLEYYELVVDISYNDGDCEEVSMKLPGGLSVSCLTSTLTLKAYGYRLRNNKA